jgi:hypothetical protein
MPSAAKKQPSENASRLRAELFRLNLGYLLTVRELLSAGADTEAEIRFGLTAPFAAWLRGASMEAITRLAASPTLVYGPRLPAEAGARILSACEGAASRRWLAGMHLALAGAETDDGAPR